MKPISELTPKELAKLAAKIRKDIRARHAREGARDPGWPGRFSKLERELLQAKPHLKHQQFCGLCPDTEDRPRRKVVMPNGFVLYSAWYKVPTTDADAKLAMREQKWLIEQGRQRTAA